MSLSPEHVTGSTTASTTVAEYQAARDEFQNRLRKGMSWSGHERNCCFLNIGGGRFANISGISGFDFIDDARAVATVDWDHDGDQDVWLTNRTSPQIRFLRNDISAGHHFLAIRLQGNGRRTNRDAIGARLELTLSGPRQARLFKSLRAGEGFLSQSSKWVHFGLGEATEIRRLVVHWPGGEREEFDKLEVDRRYRVVQGSGSAVRSPMPDRSVRLTPQPLAALEPTGTGRTFFAGRFPLPALSYEAFDGRQIRLDDLRGGPLLINLWASWCKPCLVELGEFSNRQNELRSAGLQIVALCVDGLDGSPQPTAREPRDLLKRTQFPFESGRANKLLLGKLETLQRALFVHAEPLGVPTSLLIDSRGRLSAIYRGTLDVDQLLGDVRNLSVSGAKAVDLALPFPGRRSSEPGQVTLSDVALQFLHDGYVAAAEAYLVEYEAAISRREARPSAFSYAQAHYALAIALRRAGESTRAQRHFQKAVQIDRGFGRRTTTSPSHSRDGGE